MWTRIFDFLSKTRASSVFFDVGGHLPFMAPYVALNYLKEVLKTMKDRVIQERGYEWTSLLLLAYRSLWNFMTSFILSFLHEGFKLKEGRFR